MSRDDLRGAVARYRLALPSVPMSGRAGEHLGSGAGSSLEFLDHRSYVPGDDLRHVDWRAFARTDSLLVRLFREEVAPVLDIVADVSASMASTPAKARALRDLIEIAAHLAAHAGGSARRLCAEGGGIEHADEIRPAGEGRSLLPRLPPRPRSLRLLISDFLFPRDPGPELRRLARGAACLYVVQLLDPSELEPEASGRLTLVDCELDTRLDVMLDARAVEDYGARLASLCDTVARTTRSLAGRYARVRAADPATMLREDLLRQGIREPG